MFIDFELYNNAVKWLQNNETELTQDEINTVKRKKWKFQDGKIVSRDRKYIVPKQELHESLCNNHSSVTHCRRDKLENHVKNNYAKILQIVVKLSVSLCSIFHKRQKSVADYLKIPMVHPIIIKNFLAHFQINLIDMRCLTCSCSEGHKWI